MTGQKQTLPSPRQRCSTALSPFVVPLVFPKSRRLRELFLQTVRVASLALDECAGRLAITGSELLMSVDKAGEIVRRAMAERSVYDAMAARENEVWGKILLERESSETAIEDSKAEAMLGLDRNYSSLSQLASEKELTFEHGLTLGCGAGRCERDLISRGICRSFHGIDISEHAVTKARETAQEQGLPLTYDVADLNFLKLPEKT